MSFWIRCRVAAAIVIGSTMLAACAAATTVPGNAPQAATAASAVMETFHYTGKEQTFTVPSGVKVLRAVAIGARGGGFEGRTIGLGARVEADVPVKPGERLAVFVGGQGSVVATSGETDATGGFNGGAEGGSSAYCATCDGFGGGGASDVRQNGDALKDRIVVAGGGGGTGHVGDPGGNGGAPDADRGQPREAGSYRAQGGLGGTLQKGGQGGAYVGCRYDSIGYNGADGKSAAGGAGGAGGAASQNSHEYSGSGGGGGGGGYFGGGGGGGACGFVGGSGGGGGGGSSYAEPSATRVAMQRGWKASRNGSVVFTWWPSSSSRSTP